jgi:AraC-like DNA-binding protein
VADLSGYTQNRAPEMTTLRNPRGARASEPPDDTESALATVHLLRALVRAVLAYGVSAERFFSHAGVSEAILEDDSFRAPLELERRLHEAAVELTGDPAFGLHWPERTDLRTWGPVSLVVAFVPTFRDLIAALVRYTQVFSGGMEFTCHERPTELALRFAISPAKAAICNRVYSELFVAGLTRVLKGEFPNALRGVSFAYPAPGHAAEYDVVFGGKHRFDAPHTEFVVDRAVLERPRINSSDVILKAAQHVAEEHLELQTGRASVGQRIRDHLTGAKLESADMANAARALGLSVRSLRRRLTEEGLAWPSLLNEARASQAKRLLERLSIQEAAYELGFADSSAFHRAFKRLTGITPAEFKRSRRGS